MEQLVFDRADEYLKKKKTFEKIKPSIKIGNEEKLLYM